jgi:hypothetical protein
MLALIRGNFIIYRFGTYTVTVVIGASAGWACTSDETKNA